MKDCVQNCVTIPRRNRNARKFAKISGDKYYFSGIPCVNDHIDRRQTSNGTCIKCNRTISLKHYKNNDSERKQSVKAYQLLNRDKVAKWVKKSYQNNKTSYCLRAMNRHFAKIKRTPPWLTAEHLSQIRAVYADRDQLIELTGVNFHVDHIILLQGETVSGLHVPWNLRIIPAYENLNKSNKLLREFSDGGSF